MLRRRTEGYTLQLYTYGAPRAGDTSFVKGAEALVHYRMVNHNDPVPSVPGSWMNTKAEVLGSGLILGFVNVLAGLSVFAVGITNVTGEAYEHHGVLRHAMAVQFSSTEMSSVLWEPGCDTVTQHAACSMALEQRRGLPQRAPLLAQIFNASNHSIIGSYVPAAWAALRRWQEALEFKRPLITLREFDWIDTSLINVTQQLRDTEREMRGRPDAYVRARESEARAIYKEIDKLTLTRERLKSIRYKFLKEADIYGSLADQPQVLAESLPRWRHHPENLVQEQLAMSPDRLTEGLTMTHAHSFSGDILDLFT